MTLAQQLGLAQLAIRVHAAEVLAATGALRTVAQYTLCEHELLLLAEGFLPVVKLTWALKVPGYQGQVQPLIQEGIYPATAMGEIFAEAAREAESSVLEAVLLQQQLAASLEQFRFDAMAILRSSGEGAVVEELVTAAGDFLREAGQWE